ncbi:MAG: hypothetical protein AABY64_11190 [Bdellovibrionota bacterium]
MKKILLFLPLVLSSCVTVHNISNSSFESKVTDQNTELIVAKASGAGFLHLTEPGLHIIDQLRSKCKNGIVHGIETKLSSRELIIIQFYDLEAVWDIVLSDQRVLPIT